jgi:hypothetical protein
MSFKMSPIGKKKCSYSPMQKRGLISPALNNGEPTASSGGDPEKDVPLAAAVEVERKAEKSFDPNFRKSQYYNQQTFSTDSGYGLMANIPKDWKPGKKTGRQPIYQHFSKNHPHGIEVTRDQYLAIKGRGEGPSGNTQPYKRGGVIAPGGRY